MKKLLRRTAVSILLSAPLFSAKAADMPVKAPRRRRRQRLPFTIGPGFIPA
jgi:hypothetical protein